ncbi:MAG TPA: inorganic diphosphatase [Bryobacteraceae bacterium]|jgi:inorganic pyrophosphatase|nr:inorganic diphosphatase [Bryobacteraceae bacterium]
MSTSPKRKSPKKRARRSGAEGESVAVIIETPKGSRNKFKYDAGQRMYKLSKLMPEGMVFPYDFGFVPGTKAADGDPLDVLLLTDEPLFPGCLVDAVLAGVIELEQREDGKTIRNDRLIAVALPSLQYSEVRDLDSLSPVVLRQIEAFFVNYQKVRDIQVMILGRRGPDRAREILRQSRDKV